ncbi:PAS domain-containing protein [Methylobacterium sp. 17Sr1-1]|uniref:PAS domain-containing protein n=1 Tax=Methylobacterium sp. 17Sr1-1 TaxID=2202826 RepID=UPI0013A5A7D5|nr:PAS domain-containing protein [Methylobacterium sp. 17Sr1-1]
MDDTLAAPLNLFPGDGEMAARMREHDWSATALGPTEGWPAALAVTVGIVLQAATPMVACWGPDLLILYNDAWAALVGDKHPSALGRPAREVFPEVWETLGPLFSRVLSGEGAVEVQDQHLVLDRNGTPEDAWFTHSLDPVTGADGPRPRRPRRPGNPGAVAAFPARCRKPAITTHHGRPEPASGGEFLPLATPHRPNSTAEHVRKCPVLDRRMSVGRW